jgi:hypothetical protein
MNETVIEAQARYLIEDRTHTTHHRPRATSPSRRAPNLRRLSWL